MARSRLRLVTMAQNVPGPVAVSRLVAGGASAVKIEAPWGDQLAVICPSWYEELHAGVRVERHDLKTSAGIASLKALLRDSHVFLASHRPSALARLGLDAPALARELPSLRHVNIVGDTQDPEEPGHDLTYQARAGLLVLSERMSAEGEHPRVEGLRAALPLTLLADMLGAERAHAAIVEVMHAPPGSSRVVGLYDALRDVAAPLYHGLTAVGGHLGGGNPAYGIYAAREGTIAVAALEPHFRARLYEGLGLPDGTDPSAVFATRTAVEWEAWATERDLPLAAVRDSGS